MSNADADPSLFDWLVENYSRPSDRGPTLGGCPLALIESVHEIPLGCIGVIEHHRHAPAICVNELDEIYLVSIPLPNPPSYVTDLLATMAREIGPIKLEEKVHLFSDQRLLQHVYDDITALVEEFSELVDPPAEQKFFRSAYARANDSHYFLATVLVRCLHLAMLEQRGALSLSEVLASMVQKHNLADNPADLVHTEWLREIILASIGLRSSQGPGDVLPNFAQLFQTEDSVREYFERMRTLFSIPAGIVHRLSQPESLLTRYPLLAGPPDIEGHEVGITFEHLSLLLDSLRDQEPLSSYGDLHQGVRWELRQYESRLTFRTTQDTAATHSLDSLIFIDENPEHGNYLVALFNELMHLNAIRAQQSGETWDPLATARRIVGHQLVGACRNEGDLFQARLRLGLAVWQWLEGPEVPEFPEMLSALRWGKVTNRMVSTGHPRYVESERLELKRGFDWNPKIQGRDQELRRACMRSICGFLNAKGGRLIIGVNNEGVPIGLGEELQQIRGQNRLDVMEQRVRTFLRQYIEPAPLQHVTVRFPRVANRILMEIEVEPRSEITYFKFKDAQGDARMEICVRDGNRTITLKGQERDQFVLNRV